ncbi:hypothetical protein [Neorhodopirellula pilleata]|uniref:Uncharacterized protein n=1 Tax=Neorhodopirellula pilleata TaxID=2714738 RepID=A0A5C5ZKX6_9BACT|nr:hypothetical protein [Neorhodopirellula pilleata]TWT87815.1 hypothetical protein Pla100_59100 [Neorhodopirellula pilleata]
MASSKDAATIGYFTAVQSDRTGWTGGLLILNGSGRPLEFQCTLPIRPSRAHEILFGDSLREHLISEVIGPTLLQKSRTPISLLCCQQIEGLALQDNLPNPPSPATTSSGTTGPSGIIGATGTTGNLNGVTVVGFIRNEEDALSGRRIDLSGYESLSLGSATLLVAMERLVEAQEAIGKLNELVDAMEPFERITEAIREAQSQMARAA